MDESSRYTSKLEWIWVIEALASFKEVDISILHDLIEIAPELPHNLGRNMREMLALRCLEGLFGPSNGITNASCSAPASKVCFDFSKSCEDVLQHIVHETSPSDLRTAGPELLKWDVRPFIIHKRACMPKLALQQLKDSILDGSHPYTDCLKEKSGLAFTNAILTESDPHDGNLLPSKRKKNALATENMVGDLHEHQNILNDCGDPYINAKKQKQSTSSSSQSIEENSVPVRGTELLEHLSESDIPVVHQEGCNLAKDQIGTLEEGRVTGDVNDEYTASMRCGHSFDDELHCIQSEIPDSATTMHPDTCGDEPHQNISVDEDKDDSEHCAERRTLTGSLPPYGATMMGQDTSIDKPCQKNSIDAVRDGSEQHAEPRTSSGPLLEKTRENESQCNFEHDVVLKAPHAASLDGAQQKIIDYEAEEDMDRCCEAGTSSDSDGYHKDHIDVSMKKHDFLSSQCTFSHDSLAGWTDTNLCVKCNEGGQLLVCNTSHCPLVVHEICLGSSPRFDNSGNFYCPFCAYSLAISEYLEAKKKSSLARKELSKFVRMGLEHQQKEVLERLHREKHNLSRQNEDEDPLVKSHENGYLEERVSDQTDNDGGHVNEVNNLYFRGSIDHEQQAEPSASCDNVPSSVREEEATVINGTLNVLTKEKEGEEKVIQPVSVLEGHHQQAADHECGGDNLSCRNTDVIPVNQRLVEEGIQQEVLEQQVADPTVEPVCALDIYAEDTSEDEKNKSIISNYSIRVRRQETHYKHPVSPQPRRNKVPWTAEEEVILKIFFFLTVGGNAEIFKCQ
ncbi:uncharacterized protein LOC132191381 isoform X2 [Corylus avellana]|uniref:uncharacterized protein LOC132191381 isoform X2 n=1 Tax=Corylus avellana TaxID=13451 RepID=UPI00286C0F9E|nr:uncharacterized protein LOC132191381 isoform X2 [Corylus avellana]